MNYRLKSLFIIIFIFTSLSLYQNCSGSLKPIEQSILSSTNKFSTDTKRLKIGDVAVEKSRISQQSQTQQQTTTITTLISSNSTNTTTSDYQNISYYQINPWPKSELVYKFDSSLNSREKDLFKSACATWEQESQGTIKCVALSAGSTLSSGYLLISFINGTAADCYADLGAGSGISKMVLTEGCANNSKVLHLIGHTLGFIDQHLRPDRNEFVKVPTSGSELTNFIQFKGLNYNLGSYDFSSVMNHPFTNTYQPITGELPQEVSASSVGNLARISANDKIFINKIYPQGTNSDVAADGSCSSEQLVTWGYGCYHHIPASDPAKAAGSLLPIFYNQNSAYETNSRSSAQVKCVDGSWQLQSAECSNLPGVTTGTSNQSCAQSTLRWTGTGTNSLCYLANPQSLPQSAAIGTVFEVATQQNNYPVGFGIFVCEKNPTDNVISWTYKPTLTYKSSGERYSHTKNSFCYTKQDTTDQCPSGMGFSWKSTNGNTCSGSLPNPINVGYNRAVDSGNGTWGWARVTCIKEASGNYIIFSDTASGNDMGFCGYLANGNSAPIDLNDASGIVKLAKCSPTQKLINWRDNFNVNGEECSASVNITNAYFEGQAYVYKSTLEANSFNSMVTLKCVKNTNTGAGDWVVAPESDIIASGGFFPMPICKKACLPPTQLSWINADNNYTCWGSPDQNRKLIEGETTGLIKTTNLGATVDSQAEFQCSANGMYDKAQNAANKCAR